MTETLAALILAHVLADFVLQTTKMVQGKRQPLTLALHGAIVLATATLATGSLSPLLLALAGAHIAIDMAKTLSNRRGFWPFMADQAAHLATIFALARFAPDLWSTGIWSACPTLPAMMTLAAGAILATRAGGFAIGFLMEPWAENAPAGLPNAGRVIGNLERGLIFLLILSGQAQSIGFLIAAKSILRFGSLGKDKAPGEKGEVGEKEVSEYVIIGTLASFSWAISVALATTALLNTLPALGIPDLLP